MGKVNQLGNLTEVLELCKLDDTFLPTIDFGHLNAREFGYIKGKAEYEKMLDEVENAIGHDRLKIFHSHFSKIMFTNPGGEKKHLTFDDNQGFGPDYEPLMEIVAKKDLSPIFVCESAGTQDKRRTDNEELLFVGEIKIGEYLYEKKYLLYMVLTLIFWASVSPEFTVQIHLRA